MIKLDYEKIDVSSKFYKSKNFLRAYFPEQKYLALRYDYCKKSILLLPIAWVHRLIYAVIRKDFSNNSKLPDLKYLNEHVRIIKYYEK